MVIIAAGVAVFSSIQTVESEYTDRCCQCGSRRGGCGVIPLGFHLNEMFYLLQMLPSYRPDYVRVASLQLAWELVASSDSSSSTEGR